MTMAPWYLIIAISVRAASAPSRSIFHAAWRVSSRDASISAAETDNASSYGPIKAALIHFAKGLARQYASQHIRTNVVSPGTVYFKGGVWNMIETNMPELFATSMARNPMGRMATPEDIANAAVFLSSPLSSFTSGINMVVDGALSRRVNF